MAFFRSRKDNREYNNSKSIKEGNIVIPEIDTLGKSEIVINH